MINDVILLEENWKKFQETGEIQPEVNIDIRDAWLRCRKKGVDMSHGIGVLIKPEIFEKILEKNKLFIKISESIIKQIYENLSNSDSIIFICDRDGCILEALYDKTTEVPMSEAKLIQGYRWQESENGLSSMDLAVRLNKPVQIIGAEHYCKNHHNAVGSSAPVHDENGMIIGSLNLVNFLHQYSRHSLSVVSAGAALVENQLHLMATLNLFRKTFNTMSEGMILLSQELKIKEINKNAKKILNISDEDISEFDGKEILKQLSFENIEKGKSTYLNFFYNDRIIHCFGEVDCVYINQYDYFYSIIFKEIKAINKIVNKINGNAAIYTFTDIVTVDEKMKALISYAKKTANIDSAVLITGQSGTGKELFAQAIHNYSRRSRGPFIAINCAALPTDLAESEIFGYETGAFTGAKKEGNPGKFELADGGTLFLDEIGELPLSVQSKLLRALDSHQITRIGGKTEKLIDVRVITATNRDLKQEIKSKNFRLDLYYRINMITIKLPALAERKEDIKLLATHFLNRLNQENEKNIHSMDRQFLDFLYQNDWEGNIRQLQNVIARAFYLCEGQQLTVSDLPERTSKTERDKDLHESVDLFRPVDIFEKKLIIQTLEKTNGNITEAAKEMKIAKSTLYRKMKTYGINIKRVFNED